MLNYRNRCKTEECSSTTNMIPPPATSHKKKGAKHFELYLRQSPQSWYKQCKLPRQFIVSINRIRANQYHLGASLHRLGIINDPGCPCGAESQDFYHTLWYCRNFQIQSNKL